MTEFTTIRPTDLPVASALSAEGRVVGHEPGGAPMQVPLKLLLSRLIATDTIKDTEDQLQADLAHAAHTVGLVIDDPDPLRCGWYRKTGAPGAGGWTLFETFSASVRDAVEALRDEAATSAAAAAGSAAKLTPYKVAPTAGSNPDALIWVKFYTRDAAGEPVTVPAAPVLREIQIYNTNQLRLRFGAEGGAQFAREGNTDAGDEANGTYTALDATSGKVIVDIIGDAGSSGIITNVIGQACVDLDVITPAGYSGASLELALDRPKLFQNAVEVFNIGQQIRQALIAEDTANDVFVPGASDMLRAAFPRGWGYNTPPGMKFRIGLLEKNSNRMRLLIVEDATDLPICYLQYGDGSTSVLNYTGSPGVGEIGVPSDFKTDLGYIDGGTGTFQLSGIFFAFEDVNWAAIPNGTYNFTDHADAGFRDDIMHTSDQVKELVFSGIQPGDEIIDVPNSTGALRSTVESLWEEGPYANPYTDQTDRTCRRAHPRRKVFVRLSSAFEHAATNLFRPEFVYFICQDGIATVTTEANVAQPNIQSHTSGGIWNLRGKSNPSHPLTVTNYRFHIDGVNRWSIPPVAALTALLGNKNLNRVFQDNRNILAEGRAGQSTVLFGCGIDSGSHMRFLLGGGEHIDPDATPGILFAHNSPYSTIEGVLEVDSQFMPDRLSALVVTTAHANGVPCQLLIRNMDPHIVAVGVTQGMTDAANPLPDLAADRFKWRIAGSVPAFDASGGSNGEGTEVAATTPGVTVSGTAATAIFGTIDARGRGSKLILAETKGNLGAGDVSLQTRLGNCVSVNKTLVINNGLPGQETAVVSIDCTATTEAAVLAHINGQLSTHQISIVDIGYEQTFQLPGIRRAQNDTSENFTRGQLLRFVTWNTVEKATAGASRIDAVALKLHPAGMLSEVTVSKTFGPQAIPELVALADGTEFGVGAGGRASASATPKIGRKIAGRIELY